jgi:hypothetical protein
MSGKDSIDGKHVQKDAAEYVQIDEMACVQARAAMKKRQLHSSLKGNAPTNEVPTQSRRIRGAKQSGSEGAMDTVAGFENLNRERHLMIGLGDASHLRQSATAP